MRARSLSVRPAEGCGRGWVRMDGWNFPPSRPKPLRPTPSRRRVARRRAAAGTVVARCVEPIQRHAAILAGQRLVRDSLRRILQPMPQHRALLRRGRPGGLTQQVVERVRQWPRRAQHRLEAGHALAPHQRVGILARRQRGQLQRAVRRQHRQRQIGSPRRGPRARRHRRRSKPPATANQETAVTPNVLVADDTDNIISDDDDLEPSAPEPEAKPKNTADDQLHKAIKV